MSSPRRHLRDCTARTTGTSTTKYEQQWNLYELLNCQDHGELPLHNERDVDDLNGLQLRRCHSLAVWNMSTMSQLSFWSVTAMKPSIMGLPTREEDTARGALSPTIPALYMLLQLSFWSITALMRSIMGLRTREENTARCALSPAIPALYMQLQLSFWSIPAMMPSIMGL